MSIYSTRMVSRADATGALNGVSFEELPNKLLAELLFTLLADDTMHNFIVADQVSGERTPVASRADLDRWVRQLEHE